MIFHEFFRSCSSLEFFPFFRHFKQDRPFLVRFQDGAEPEHLVGVGVGGWVMGNYRNGFFFFREIFGEWWRSRSKGLWPLVSYVHFVQLGFKVGAYRIHFYWDLLFWGAYSKFLGSCGILIQPTEKFGWNFEYNLIHQNFQVPKMKGTHLYKLYVKAYVGETPVPKQP